MPTFITEVDHEYRHPNEMEGSLINLGDAFEGPVAKGAATYPDVLANLAARWFWDQAEGETQVPAEPDDIRHLREVIHKDLQETLDDILDGPGFDGGTMRSYCIRTDDKWLLDWMGDYHWLVLQFLGSQGRKVEIDFVFTLKSLDEKEVA